MILKDRSAGGRKPILRSGPVVCCVQDAYQILVPVNVPVLMSVIVGDTEYVNHVGGVRVSDAPVQRFTVPQAALDAAGAYTLVYLNTIKPEQGLDRSAAFEAPGPA